MLKDEIGALDRAFTALGDDPDYLADLITKAAGHEPAEQLRDLFQAVGSVLDAAKRPA